MQPCFLPNLSSLPIGVNLGKKKSFADILAEASKNKDVKAWIDSVIKRDFPGHSWVLVSAGGGKKLAFWDDRTKKQLLREIATFPGYEPRVHNGSDGFLYMMFPLMYTNKEATVRLIAHLMNYELTYAYLLSGLDKKGKPGFNLSDLTMADVDTLKEFN